MRDALADELRARAPVVAAAPDLAALADRLREFLTPLTSADLYFPEQKALLSRDGGRCPSDGARLLFDPLTPHEHRCGRCGALLTGERHHRAWIVPYHLWLSERAVHAAVLGVLRDDGAARTLATAILDGYAARYRTWPNRDNVLGPGRLFFSTYLESIWLAQLMVAGSILDASGTGPGSDVETMVGESVALIASFAEGRSNRQAWHAAAVTGAGVLLRDPSLVREGVEGADGLVPLLRDGVGGEGMWHEGENYHFFALRGLALGAELARWSGTGHRLYAEGPLRQMFVAPLATLLPDWTLPARGDAPYGVSVRQPRFAELWEWGRARGVDRRMNTLLARLYAQGGDSLEDDGAWALSEQEWNRPAAALARPRLSWKALLWMLPDAPADEGHDGIRRSVVLADQGVAVLRDGDRRYVSVECGARRGGHGHPDLLHVSLFWDQPVLADFGTGSYVSPSLRWYRSTEAHNAPGLPDAGQVGVEGRCAAADGAGPWRWCQAVAPGLFGPGTLARRTVITGPEYAVDVVDVDVPASQSVALAVHPLTHPDRVHLVPREGETIETRTAPGPPGADFGDGADLAYAVRVAAGPGRWIQVIDPDGVVRGADDSLRVTTDRGRTAFVWRGTTLDIRPEDGAPVRLSGTRPEVPAPPPSRAPAVVSLLALPGPPDLSAWPRAPVFRMGADQYRRSEVAYGDIAVAPSALVAVGVHGPVVGFWFRVGKADLVFRAGDEPDPALDNETADIHSDGVQCYVGRDAWCGWLAVPVADTGTVRVRPVAGTAARADRASGLWRQVADGYEIVVLCDTGRAFGPGDRFRFNAVVNEMRPDRVRRAGQLALTGGGWVYLRGDREPAEASPVAVVT